jgi:hypothetical protein
VPLLTVPVSAPELELFPLDPLLEPLLLELPLDELLLELPLEPLLDDALPPDDEPPPPQACRRAMTPRQSARPMRDIFEFPNSYAPVPLAPGEFAISKRRMKLAATYQRVAAAAAGEVVVAVTGRMRAVFTALARVSVISIW